MLKTTNGFFSRLAKRFHRHQWEDNLFIGRHVVEQRCITCGGHRHSVLGEWSQGRYKIPRSQPSEQNGGAK